MTRISGCITVALLACAIPAPARAGDKPPADLDRLAWLVGSWIERKQGVETDVHWIAPKGGIMLGVNRTVRAAGKTSFEFMRIARTPSGISYCASPAGGTATEFHVVEAGDKKVVFENPKHDFPTRILYWLDGDGASKA